jgi:PKD repeat protein|tara:strand:+ start:8452 stop:9222 length:771 start_codon:yes stop_codon:yes gene_type:complete
MNYSFNKDYSSLSGIIIPLDIYNKNFKKILGLGTNSADLSSNIYTGDLGGIYAVPNFLSANPIISDTDFFVDFGDGTVVENNLSAFHTYKTSGNFRVTLVVATSSGELFSSNNSFNVNVKDPVPDLIFIAQDAGTQSESESTVRFYITRFNNIATSRELSANDYKINLSVNGNNSPLQLESKYLDNMNFQYQNKSFFFTSPDENFEVIDSLKTNSTFIYGKLSSGELILTTVSADDTTLVGTSGFGSFRYYEPTYQ